MRKLTYTIIGILSFSLSIAFANIAKADADLKLDLARAYFELPAIKELYKNIIGIELKHIELLSEEFNYDKEHAKAIEKVIRNEMAKTIDIINEIMIEDMVDLYTLKELEAQYEFYSSEIGSNIILKNGIMFEKLASDGLLDNQMELLEVISNVFEMEKAEVLKLSSDWDLFHYVKSE